jgi:hypothetical protein
MQAMLFIVALHSHLEAHQPHPNVHSALRQFIIWRSIVKGGMHTRHAPTATATAASATAVATASTTACAERGCISEEGRAGKEARSPQTAHGSRADGGRKRGISHQQNRMTTRNTTYSTTRRKNTTRDARKWLRKRKKTSRKTDRDSAGDKFHTGRHNKSSQVK